MADWASANKGPIGVLAAIFVLISAPGAVAGSEGALYTLLGNVVGAILLAMVLVFLAQKLGLVRNRAASEGRGKEMPHPKDAN